MSETAVSVPRKAITNGPSVQWNHIDGPLMTWAGQLHWLTWKERMMIDLGVTTVDLVAERHWPHLARHRAALSAALSGEGKC